MLVLRFETQLSSMRIVFFIDQNAVYTPWNFNLTISEFLLENYS